MRAISRRTPSKAESTTAFGVSSMMKSTPVRFSRARMLRPSRPMMRPFMSSEGSWTTDTVVSAAWLAARRCIATDEDRAHAALGVALGLLLDLADDPRASRGGPGPRRPCAARCLAWPALRPAMRSSARTCSSRSLLELARARRRARATRVSSSRSRRSISSVRRSSERSSDCERAALRMSCSSRWRSSPSPVVVVVVSATPSAGATDGRRPKTMAAATIPPARTTAAITNSIAVSSPRRPRGGDRPSVLRVHGATDRPRRRTYGDGSAARRPRFSGAAEVRRSGSTDVRVRLGISRWSVLV